MPDTSTVGSDPISIHAPREGSDVQRRRAALHDPISIHAPREGSDAGILFEQLLDLISIHAPREGSDQIAEPKKFEIRAFQSTLPVRGATFWKSLDVCSRIFQSTLPVRGATAILAVLVVHPLDISIHAPREGSDPSAPLMVSLASRFQSTLPVRGATCFLPVLQVPKRISIHAPREGSDHWPRPPLVWT